MQAARKTYPKLSPESRNKSYAAININFLKIRPDLKGESKEILREERLGYITEILGKKHQVKTTKALTDSELHYVLDQMNSLLNPELSPKTTAVKIVAKTFQAADVVHLTSEQQQYAFDILIPYLGWTREYKEEYLTKRWRRKSEKMLTFAQANSLMMQLLNTAASKDRKSLKKPTGRIENRKHIPIIKAKLGIDQKQ